MSAGSWTNVLFEAIGDAVFVHDAEGRILEANPAACQRLGYTRDELLKLTTNDIDAPEFADGFESRLRSQLQGGGMRCEGVHRTKDGKRIPVDINTTAVQLDGKPAILAVMRDITKRKHNEEALGKQRQLLQSILDNMSDAIVVTDAEERVILFNPPAERVFGPELVQGGFTLARADRSAETIAFPVSRCLRDESFDGLELLVRHEEAPKGTWVSIAGRPLRERGGAIKGGVLVCHDITTRRRDERRIKAQYDLARVIAADRPFTESARAIVRILCDALDFDVGILWVGGGPEKVVCPLETWHHPQAAVEDFLAQSQQCLLSATADLVGLVWEDGKARHYQLTESAWSASPRWRSAQGAGLRAVLAFPIHCGAETVGVLELWSRWLEADDDSLMAMLQAMANQVGQFLERQQVEKELRDSQALYESLVRSLPQNIFRKDRDSRVTFANQRYCESLKKPLAELLGKTDFDLFPADLAEKYVRDDRLIMASGETLNAIEEHHLPDGRHLYVHVVKTPVRNAENEVVGVQGIFWDVTQEVSANQAIAESEKRYRQLTEATMDGIVVIDPQGLITLFNPAAERMFGYTAAEVVGVPINRLMPEECAALLPAPLRERNVGNDANPPLRLRDILGKPQEFKGRRKDGTDFPIEIAVSVLSGADGELQGMQILAAIRDLTERNKLRAVLVQNEKLASIGLLSAGVAHEINNPLAFVGNNLVVLERDCKGLIDLLKLYDGARPAIAQLDPALANRVAELTDAIDLPYIQENTGRLLSRTRDGIDRVTRIVHSLRGMARTEAPRRLESRLPDMINSSLEILNANFKRLGVVIEQSHDANPVIACVPTQISQVVLNILVNAFQAIEAAKRSQGRIMIRTQRVGNEMLLEIKDNGTGIKPEHMQRVFDPFFTTKDVGEGTGLGLSISHHIITAHGGRVEADTKLGEETCFRIYLPVK